MKCIASQVMYMDTKYAILATLVMVGMVVGVSQAGAAVGPVVEDQETESTSDGCIIFRVPPCRICTDGTNTCTPSNSGSFLGL